LSKEILGGKEDAEMLKNPEKELRISIQTRKEKREGKGKVFFSI